MINFILKNFQFNLIWNESIDLGSGDRFLKDEFEDRGIIYEDYDIMDIDFEKDKFKNKDNEFDLVISLAVLEHIKNPNLFLDECKEFLRKILFYIFRHLIGNIVKTLLGRPYACKTLYRYIFE